MTGPLRHALDRLRAAAAAAAAAARATADPAFADHLDALARTADGSPAVAVVPLHDDPDDPTLRGFGDVPAPLIRSPAADALAGDPVAVGRLLTDTPLVLVVGPADHAPAPAAAALLADLAAAATAAWAVPLGAADPAGGWAESFPRVVAPAEVAAALAPDSPHLAAVALRHALARFAAAVPEVTRVLRRESVRVELRRAAVTDAPPPDDPAGWRAAAEAVRREAEERVADLTTRLADAVRQALLPAAAPVNRVSNLLEDLAETDMTEEPAGRVVRLRVGVQFRHRGEKLLRELVGDRVATDLAVLQAGLDDLHAALTARLAGTGLPPAAVAVPESVRATLDGLTHLDPRYQVELPRRTWADRLGYGRRPVFLVTMLVSLVGAAAGARSSLMLAAAPVLLFLFVGGVVWSFRSFRQEREDLLEKELGRLREGFREEMRRAFEQAAREWQARVVGMARDAGRTLGREAEQVARRLADEAARRTDEARKAAREQLRVLDARARELGQLGAAAETSAKALWDAARGLDRSGRRGA